MQILPLSHTDEKLLTRSTGNPVAVDTVDDLAAAVTRAIDAAADAGFTYASQAVPGGTIWATYGNRGLTLAVRYRTNRIPGLRDECLATVKLVHSDDLNPHAEATDHDIATVLADRAARYRMPPRGRWGSSTITHATARPIPA